MFSSCQLLNQKISLPLLFLLIALQGCGGGDRFSTETAPEEEDTEEESAVTLDLGTDSGGSFNDGVLNTDIPTGTSLSFGGDSVISVNIVDDTSKELFTAEAVSVNFSSNCTSADEATITSPVITSSGTAEATYSATTCEGPDVITATLEDGTSASVNITVAEQEIGTLEFVSSSPSTLALSGGGSSSNPDFSEVTFIARDDIGQPIEGETVSFTLSTSIGGISLSSDTAITNSEGNSKRHAQRR